MLKLKFRLGLLSIEQIATQCGISSKTNKHGFMCL